MKSIFVLFLFLGSAALAQVASSPPLKTISEDFFKPGQQWLWKYFQDHELYSTEKYRVLEASENRVLFEMSTKLAEENQFKIHHRLEVDPRKCLRAYQNPSQHRPYSFKLYYYQEGQWQLVEGLTSPIPFEEKFNCNPHRFRGSYRNTYFQTLETDLGPQEVFQQRKGPWDKSSWYFNTSDYPGILAFKRMSRPQERVQYHVRFSLTE